MSSMDARDRVDPHTALLMIGASEVDADLFYATQFLAPDPFIFLETRGRRYVVLHDLERDRARKQARVDEVLSYSIYEERARKRGVDAPGVVEVLHEVLQDLEVRKLVVPARFWVEKALLLQERGYEIEVRRGPFFPERARKRPDEIQAIRETLRAAESALDRALEILREAQIRDGVLFREGEVLTSERLRREIHRHLLDFDCVARHTIVACGEDTCDPHQEGKGPLRPHQPIILDIFPQSMRTRYFADLTRTVVKGRASEPLRRMYDAVRQAQELALSQIRAGVEGRAVHEQVVAFFRKAGYETGERDGHMQGFFHGTGHGLGLEVHEPPRISPRGGPLEVGHVVTVEPGLYYPGMGGVRLEDLVVVQEDGCENLTTAPKFLEV